MAGKLYLVPTPIGNLADMTFRAIEVLKSVDFVLVEDTRISKKLFTHFEIETRMESYHEHNKADKLPWVLEQLKDHKVALISDAGSPAISDPGFELVRACIQSQVELIVLPGATAFVPALTLSGLPTSTFTFLGFPPKKSTQRQNFFSQYVEYKDTLIFYESPYRLQETLTDLYQVFGDRAASVSRELTKKFESTYRMPLSQAVEFFAQNSIAGEVVICVAGIDKDSQVWDEAKVIQALRLELNAHQSLSVAAKNVAKQSGWRKSKVYELGLKV